MIYNREKFNMNFTKDELKHLYELAIEDKDRTINSNYEKFSTDVINKLQSMIDNYCESEELTEPEPKYKVGDTIYFYVDYEMRIYSFAIAHIDYDGKEIFYTDKEGEFCVTENRAFLSKETLIKAQVDYWLGMLEMPEQIRYFAKQAKPMECEHEHDYCVYYKRGDEYIHPYPISDFKIDPKKDIQYYKCKKCGEFYR